LIRWNSGTDGNSHLVRERGTRQVRMGEGVTKQSASPAGEA
jgi:hypothetical protein